jgi:hypothetical protein
VFIFISWGTTRHFGSGNIPGLQVVGVQNLWLSIQKKENPQWKVVQPVNMPKEACLLLGPLCNVCIIGDGQVLANNKNYLKLENVIHLHWNSARILVSFISLGSDSNYVIYWFVNLVSP